MVLKWDASFTICTQSLPPIPVLTAGETAASIGTSDGGRVKVSMTAPESMRPVPVGVVICSLPDTVRGTRLAQIFPGRREIAAPSGRLLGAIIGPPRAACGDLPAGGRKTRRMMGFRSGGRLPALRRWWSVGATHDHKPAIRQRIGAYWTVRQKVTACIYSRCIRKGAHRIVTHRRVGANSILRGAYERAVKERNAQDPLRSTAV